MILTNRARKNFFRVLFTIIIGAFALTMITPFLWMLSASMKRALDVMALPIDWIPDYFYPDNYMKVWNIGDRAVRDYHFGLAYFNSLKVAFVNLAGSVLTSTLAGYAFAKLKLQGPALPSLSGHNDDTEPGDAHSQICNLQRTWHQRPSDAHPARTCHDHRNLPDETVFHADSG